MRNLLISISIISFASISVFGFFAMGHAADHGNCIAATLNGKVCAATDIFGVAAYHLSAFQKAARAILASVFAALALILLAVLFLAFFRSPTLSHFRLSSFAFSDNFNNPQKLALRRWLSFHENSPNFFGVR